MIVANRFLGLVLEVVQRGGEIIAANRGIFLAGILEGFILVFILMNVRGRSQWFRRGGLCVLGSVYYGRGAGVSVSRLRAALSLNKFIAFVVARVRARLLRDVV
jgi:hypothetical protein